MEHIIRYKTDGKTNEFRLPYSSQSISRWRLEVVLEGRRLVHQVDYTADLYRVVLGFIPEQGQNLQIGATRPTFSEFYNEQARTGEYIDPTIISDYLERYVINHKEEDDVL